MNTVSQVQTATEMNAAPFYLHIIVNMILYQTVPKTEQNKVF